MDAFTDYDDYDAVGLAGLVAAGEVKPRQLVDAAALRIQAVNPAINAVIWQCLDQARDEAAQQTDGPFGGVPILIKDLVSDEGTPVTFGSVFFRDYVGEVTSEFRRRVRAAGFIELGRTNTPEFGLLPTTEPVLHGPTRNPWDLSRSSGGSSGGAAAAVAAGIVPLAQGSDGGGSIRIPASACGVFGLKPSRGRNPRRPPVSSDSLSVDGALTRTVRDSAAFLDAIHGPMQGDEYWAPPPSGSFSDAVSTDPGRLRIAYSVRDFRGIRVHPDCEAAVVETAELLATLGHDVVEAAPELDGNAMGQAFLELWASLAEHGFRNILVGAEEVEPRVRHLRRFTGDLRTMKILSRITQRETNKPAFEPFTFTLAGRSARRSPADLLTAQVTLQEVSRDAGRFLEEHDVFLTPVLGSPPVPLDAIDQTQSWDEFTEMTARYVAFTPLANFSGLPAMSVPLYWTDDGLPVGSHFLGRFGDEETLLSIAGQLERARPWADRRPPVFADV
ncbi:MAG: amidase [Acidimicrobiia bacterium]|nr:MAG: amidase [Acidimicrobiia bacterium]